MNLSTRLTLAMVALVLVTAAVSGLVTYRNITEAVLPSELARLQAHAGRQAAYLEALIAGVRSDVQVFETGAAALDGIIRARSNGGVDPEDGSSEEVWRMRLARRFVAELQAKTDYVQIRLIGVADGGREIVRVDRSGPAGAVRIVPADELQRKGDRDYFVETLRLPPGRIYLSRLDLNQEGGKIEVPHRPVIRAATPVYTAAGDAFGILIINADLRPTFALMSTPEHSGGQVMVVNRDGYYLHHPQPEKTYAFDLGRADRLQQDYPGLADSLGATGGFARMTESRTGETIGAALAPARAHEGPWVGVVEVVPRAQLLAAGALVRRSSLIAGGAVTLLAVGLAVWLGRSLTNPLVTLTRSVKSFSSGETRPVKVRAAGEIGVLARAFAHLQQEMSTKTEALRLTLDAVDIGHWDLDLVTHAANRSVRHDRIFGYPEPQPTWSYETFLAHVEPEDRDRVDRLFQAGVAAKTQWDFECRIRRPDGSLGWIWAHGNVITNATGEPVRMLGLVSDITKRKEAEAALSESEDRFRTMANSIPHLAWIAHSDGFIFWYNQRWYEYTGTTAAQMEGWGWQSVHDPEVLPKVMVNWKAAIDSGQPFEMEFPLRGADGQFRTFLTRGHPLKDSQGRVVQWFGTNTDVDVLKRMEDSLRATQARLKSTLAAGSIGTWTWDIPKDRLVADEFTARAFGVEVEAAAKGLPVTTYLQAVVEEDQPAVSANLARAVETCGHYDIEYRVRQKDGGLLWLQARGRVEGDQAGKALNFHGAVMDITARKLAEAAVRASEEHFRFLNDLAVATRLLADPAQIMAVSARMLGEHLHASRCAYAEVEADSEKFTILHDYTDGCASTAGQYQLSLFGPRAVATLHRGETLIIRNVEAELRADEGSDMFNAIGIQAIVCCPLVKEGGLRAMMAVHQTTPRDWQSGEIALVQDVVERCWATIERGNAEKKIWQLNIELEKRVVDRTEQLVAANKELEAFTYSVSHDLRAPLRAVDGFSQAVVEDFGAQLPEEGRRQLQIIRQSAQRMGALIDDLLTFSRLGREALKKGPVDTGRLVQEALGELGQAGKDPRVQIRMGELPTCLGDAALLKQVWVNLLENALKYSRKRHPAIIEIDCIHQDGERVYYVRDNGTGFDMKYADKLFGVFQRLHLMEDYEGTGVGLATVQRIIQRHGGRVWADAEPDHGATFSFTLPPT